MLADRLNILTERNRFKFRALIKGGKPHRFDGAFDGKSMQAASIKGPLADAGYSVFVQRCGYGDDVGAIVCWINRAKKFCDGYSFTVFIFLIGIPVNAFVIVGFMYS